MNDTHLTSLYVGNTPASKGNTLTAGQVEIDGTLFQDGTLTAAGAATVGTTLSVGTTLTATGNIVASSGVTVAKNVAVTGNLAITGVITGGAKIVGSSTFTTLGLTKQVTVAGMANTDIIIAIPTGASIGANEVLCTSAGTGNFTVTRSSGQTSGLPFAYVIVRPA